MKNDSVELFSIYLVHLSCHLILSSIVLQLFYNPSNAFLLEFGSLEEVLHF